MSFNGFCSSSQPVKQSAKASSVVSSSQRAFRPMSKVSSVAISVSKMKMYFPDAQLAGAEVPSAGATRRVHCKIKSPAMVPGMTMQRYCK